MPRKVFFTPVGDRTAFDQGHGRIGDKGRVDAQVLLAGQVPGQGVEQGAEGETQAAAVFDHRGHVGRHAVVDVIHRPAGKQRCRFGAFHQQVKFIHGDEGVSVGAGNVSVDFPDDHRRLGHDLPPHIHGDAQRAEPVGIRRGDLDQGHIHGQLPAFDQPRNGGEATGDQIHPSGGDGLAGHPAGEEGFQPVLVGAKLFQGDDIPEAQDLDQGKVLKVQGIRCHEAFDQGAGFGGTGAQKNVHSRFDAGQGLIRRRPFFVPVVGR